MGDPHRQNVGALDTAMVVRHRDNFNSARGPLYTDPIDPMSILVSEDGHGIGPNDSTLRQQDHGSWLTRMLM